MITIERSALVPFSAVQMYELVNDVSQYPQFMHGCIAAEEVSRTPEELVGRLTLGKAGLRYSFTTRNVLTAGERMDLTLVEGPFRSFSATWHFKALTADASKVSLVMHFEWAGGLLGVAMEKLFQHSANSLVDEVVNRAHKVYGAR
jgi:ribosome-associated toxin RatA of RatAB toxin-antitoxin module